MATGKVFLGMSLAALFVCQCHAARLDETFTGRTWYVSVHAPAGGDGSREAPFNTIQAAVSAAADGDSIRLSEGVFGAGTTSYTTTAGFASLSRVDVTKRLRITGAGRGKTFVQGAAAASGDADGCGAGAVRGFRIADAAAGTLIERLTIVGGRTPSADVTQTTDDSGVSVTYMDGDTARWIADAGANTAAKGGGVWYGGSAPVYLADVTVTDCRAGYAGGGVCGNVVLLRTKVENCRGGLLSSGALYGVTGIYSSWIVGCGGTADRQRNKLDAVLGFAKGQSLCTFVNCTMSMNLGNGIPQKLSGRSGFFTPACAFYNCAFFDGNQAMRFTDNQGAFDIWNCAMNSNGSMPNNKNNIGGDWGANKPNERHLYISTSSHAAGPFDPYGTGYGWWQLVSPVNNARLRPGSALIDQGSNDWITVKGTFIPDEYVAFDFDGEARIQGAQVDMGAFEGGTPYGAVYTISTGNTYPVSVNGSPIDFSGYAAYISGQVGEHLTLEADTGGTPLFAFTTTGLSVNGNAASYRYLYPDGQTTKVDLVVDAAGITASYGVVPAASTIWVSPDGNDSAAGTFDAPVRTLQKANDRRLDQDDEEPPDGDEGAARLRRGRGREHGDHGAAFHRHRGLPQQRVRRGRAPLRGHDEHVCGDPGIHHHGRRHTHIVLAAGKRDPNNLQAYNWGSSGVCGWTWPSSGQVYVQVIDCIISNNVAYRSTALANVLARRCLITQNHTVDFSLETNACSNVGGLMIDTGLADCQITDNDVQGWLIHPNHPLQPVVNNTIRAANSEQTIFLSTSPSVCNNIFLEYSKGLSSYLTEGSGNLLDPELRVFEDGTFGVLAGSQAATAGNTTNAAFLAVSSGGLDGVWPELPAATCPAGCYQRIYPAILASASGDHGISPSGLVGADWGESVTLTASDAATRRALGMELDGALVPGATSYTWRAYGFDDDPLAVRAVYATNWYVNANASVGDDAKNGWTPETPKRTLAAALALTWPGDVVHAAPGRYDEGEMVQNAILVGAPPEGDPMVKCRAFLREGVSLVADGDTPEETAIVGIGHDNTETRTFNWGKFQLGVSNVRCVAMEANTRLVGFTLTDGGTAHASTHNDNTCGGGVLARDLTARVEDCIITNCFSAYAGGGKNGTYVRCRFELLGAVSTAGAAYGARLYCCYIGNCFDVPIDDNQGLYNCTFGPTARIQFSSELINTLIRGFNKPIVNCLILTKLSGKNILSYSQAFNNLVSADMGPCFVSTGDSANNVTNIPAANLAIDAVGRPLAGSLAIDAGDNSRLVDGLTDVADLGGGQRIYNGTVDVGCGEFDWRPAFGEALGMRGSTVSVAKADPDVRLAEQGVEIRDGALTVGLARGGGVVLADAEVLGGGTLRACLGEVEVGARVAAQGAGLMKVSNPSGNDPRELRFAYAAEDGDTRGALLKSLVFDVGTMLIFR